MKVVREAAKEQKAVASLRPRRSMRNPVSNGVTPVPQTDAVEVKSSTTEQSVGEKLSTSRVQQSMRRSKFSGELDRDMAFPAPPPSARPATATAPLNPVTPLRWKSSKRLELEKKKLQEELKAKEEEKKNPKPAAKEEKKEQHSSKTTAMPKLQVNVVEVSHKVNKETRFATSASASGSMVPPQTNGKVSSDIKHSFSVTSGENNTLTEEASPLDGIDRSNGDVAGTDRKALPGDESSVITIDFLRARLLAERASSKAAKELIQQVTKKVLELEDRLDKEIQARKKAEEAAQEALVKFELLEKTGKQASKESSKVSESRTSVAEKLWGPNQVSKTDISESLSPHGKKQSEQQGRVLLSNQGEGKCQVPVQVHEAVPNASVVTIPLDIKNGSKQLTSEVKLIPSSEQGIGDHHGIQNLGEFELQEDTNPSVNQDANSGLKEQEERRSAVEERLRHMWDEMREEMAALAEDQTQGELGREELLNWMGQVPSVLQDILPKPSEDTKLVITSRTTKVQLKGGDDLPASLRFYQALKEDRKEDLFLNGASSGDERSHAKGVKKVASLIERFEAQESFQREWEQSNAKQNLSGRRRSNEASITRANSSSGTPEHSTESQQENCHQEQLGVAPKLLSQIENPRYDSHVTNSSVSPRPCLSTGSLLTRPENGKVDIQTPEIGIPSTDPDPPTVEERVERSDEGGITHGGSQRTDDSIPKDADRQSERPLTPFITPLPHITSPRPSALENEGVCDPRRSRADRSQVVLKQSNHHLNPRALEGTYESLEGHSGRSNPETDQPTRSQTVPSWVNLEEAEMYGMPADKGSESALQWDASYDGLHLQQESLASYSQAGNSNAYVRLEVPGSYPLRNDEREIYRGRMESVSRSMEGLGGSWRSVADHEGDEINQPYADMPVSSESGTRRPGHQQMMSFQGNGGSGRSNYYQAESTVGLSQNFAHPGREFPRDNFLSRPSTKLESSASKVNEVLKALQLAKLSIQKTGGRRTSISNTCYSTSEHSNNSGGAKYNLKTDYEFHGGDGMTNRSPVAIRVWSHQELSRRYSTGSFREPGSPPRLQHSTSSAPVSMMTDARGKDHEEDHPLAGRSSPVSNARRKCVDKVSTGGGVQYIYPN